MKDKCPEEKNKNDSDVDKKFIRSNNKKAILIHMGKHKKCRRCFLTNCRMHTRASLKGSNSEDSLNAGDSDVSLRAKSSFLKQKPLATIKKPMIHISPHINRLKDRELLKKPISEVLIYEKDSSDNSQLSAGESPENNSIGSNCSNSKLQVTDNRTIGTTTSSTKGKTATKLISVTLRPNLYPLSNSIISTTITATRNVNSPSQKESSVAEIPLDSENVYAQDKENNNMIKTLSRSSSSNPQSVLQTNSETFQGNETLSGTNGSSFDKERSLANIIAARQVENNSMADNLTSDQKGSVAVNNARELIRRAQMRREQEERERQKEKEEEKSESESEVTSEASNKKATGAEVDVNPSTTSGADEQDPTTTSAVVDENPSRQTPSMSAVDESDKPVANTAGESQSMHKPSRKSTMTDTERKANFEKSGKQSTISAGTQADNRRKSLSFTNVENAPPMKQRTESDFKETKTKTADDEDIEGEVDLQDSRRKSKVMFNSRTQSEEGNTADCDDFYSQRVMPQPKKRGGCGCFGKKKKNPLEMTSSEFREQKVPSMWGKLKNKVGSGRFSEIRTNEGQPGGTTRGDTADRKGGSHESSVDISGSYFISSESKRKAEAEKETNNESGDEDSDDDNESSQNNITENFIEEPVVVKKPVKAPPSLPSSQGHKRKPQLGEDGDCPHCQDLQWTLANVPFDLKNLWVFDQSMFAPEKYFEFKFPEPDVKRQLLLDKYREQICVQRPANTWKGFMYTA